MPNPLNRTLLPAIFESQPNCKLCDISHTDENIKHYIMKCEVCQRWSCLDCAEMSIEMFELAEKTKAKLHFICPHCEDALPQLRELMQIKEKQEELSLQINTNKGNIQNNMEAIADQKTFNGTIETRLDKIEKALMINKILDDDFPTLPHLIKSQQKLEATWRTSTNKINVAIQKQSDQTQEDQRKAANANNLIVYGAPELDTDDVANEMKADFALIKHLYDGKATLAESDIANLTRIGNKKANVTRPIRITFKSLEKRKEILINNQDLLIQGEEHKMCNCTKNPGKHIHVNITTDKTKLEREAEKKLRQELKQRREAGEEEIIIKYGKIVSKTEQRQNTPRWSDVVES